MEAKDRLLIALDDITMEDPLRLQEELHELVGGFKVGIELFTACGPEAVWELHRTNNVFLDLKYHGIPHSVTWASCTASFLPIRMFSVHCLGGPAMMRAARKGVQEAERVVIESGVEFKPPLILGATLLTSSDDEWLTRIGIVENQDEVWKRVVQLATEAEAAGLDGVVVSPLEVAAVRKSCRPDFKIVAVGVRQRGSSRHDHTRIGTPYEAIRHGADYLVVGRPITTASNPVPPTKSIVAEIAVAMKERG